MKKQYFPKWSLIICLFVFILQCFAYHYNRILPLRPTSVHHWRQVDGLVIAQNYYEENRGFFNPATNQVLFSGSRNAVSEFPLIQFLVAKLWKLFGVHEWMYRLINILFLIAGLVLFMKAVEKEIRNSVWAIFICLLLFSSVTVAFYANNFIPDIPALGCILAASGLLIQYRHTASLILFIGSVLFFTLGVLFKVSFAIVPLAFATLWLFQRFSKRIHFYHDSKIEISGFVFFTASVTSWLWWAHKYNKSSGQGVFLASIRPIWETKKIEEVTESLRDIFSWPLYELFSAPLWCFFLAVFFAVIFNVKKADIPLSIISALLFFAGISYSILFFQNFPGHDYYYITLIPFVAFTLFSGVAYLKINHERTLNSGTFLIGTFILICLNTYIVSVKMDTRYFKETKKRPYPFVITRQQKEWINYSHWHHSITMKAYEKITPYLRLLGIKREDMVVCLEDPSPNISLYMANQIGWTSFGLNENDPNYINDKINRGAKYLLLNREFLKEKEFVKPFTVYKMGQHENVEIFDLRPFKKN